DAALNEARLLVQTDLSERPSQETIARFKDLLRSIAQDFKVVAERVDDRTVTAARERAEDGVREWSEAELNILSPPHGGLTEVPVSFSIAQKSDAANAALDDLVQMVAAYGFNYRM